MVVELRAGMSIASRSWRSSAAEGRQRAGERAGVGADRAIADYQLAGRLRRGTCPARREEGVEHDARALGETPARRGTGRVIADDGGVLYVQAPLLGVDAGAVGVAGHWSARLIVRHDRVAQRCLAPALDAAAGNGKLTVGGTA